MYSARRQTEVKKAICLGILEALESSSSDSDDTDSEVLDLVTSVTANLAARIRRETAVRYVDSTLPNYAHAEFVAHFRIEPELFESLVGQYSQTNIYRAQRHQGGGWQMPSAEKQMYVYMWYLGHPATSFREMGNRFSICTYSVGSIITKLNGFMDQLCMDVIKWPDHRKKAEISKHFYENGGLSNVIGCIEGFHVKINSPGNNTDYYLNKLNSASLQVQTIVDCNYKFIDVFTGYPGSVHDATVLKNCFLYEDFPDLCKDCYLVGDNAYPLRQWLITPYQDNGYLTREQKTFNDKINNSLVFSDRAISMVRQRFPILKFIPLRSMKSIADIIMSCCVLHNLCDDNMEFTQDGDRALDGDKDPNECDKEEMEDNCASPDGEEFRDSLCEAECS